MPTPHQEAVLKALTDFIATGHNVGLAKVVRPLEHFHAEFQTTKPTLKLLQGPVNTAAGIAFSEIRDRVYDMVKDKPRPRMKKHDQELDRSFRALQDVVYPPTHPETDIVGL